jgi:MoxR-like ATPase
MYSNSSLDTAAIPKLVGNTAKERLLDAFGMLANTKIPLYFTGPSGSGKTVVALNLAKAYALKFKVPAYYVQLSPDMSKTSLILGLRLQNGSLVPVDGVIAEAMRTGGVVVVDETTHTTQELLLMMNSVLDRTSVTSIGDEIIFAEDSFRCIFCSNFGYAGNIKLPPSFAQRLYAYDFDYPSQDDEVAIAEEMAKSEIGALYSVPKIAVRYIVALMRENRSSDMPLSVRNTAMALTGMSLAKKNPNADVDEEMSVMTEASARKIAERLAIKQVNSVQDLLKSDLKDFMEYTAEIGFEKFRNIVRSSFGYHLDIDGVDVATKAWKAELDASII